MNKHGFTFIEVLISIILLGIMVTVTLPLSLQVNKMVLKSKSRYELGKLVESYMEEIKASGNILIGNKQYSFNDLMDKTTIILLDPYNIKIIVNRPSLQSIAQIHFHVTDNKTQEIYELSSCIYFRTYMDYCELSKE